MLACIGGGILLVGACVGVCCCRRILHSCISLGGASASSSAPNTSSRYQRQLNELEAGAEEALAAIRQFPAQVAALEARLGGTETEVTEDQEGAGPGAEVATRTHQLAGRGGARHASPSTPQERVLAAARDNEVYTSQELEVRQQLQQFAGSGRRGGLG